VLRAISGAGGALPWEAREPVFATSARALGDLDGDGRVEVVAAAADGRHVLAFDDRGTRRWVSDELPQYLDLSPMSLSDLDGDGRAEVIAGLSVVEHDGRVRWWREVGA